MPITKTNLTTWKVISTETLLDNKFLPVYKEVVETGQGKVIDDFYHAHIDPAVMVLPILKNGNLVLVRQYKHGIGEVIIELVAGLVHNGEDLKDAAVRELEEEVGIKVQPEQLIEMGRHSQSPSKLDHVAYGFLVRDVEFNGETNFDEHEDIETVELTLDEALAAIKSGEIWASDAVAYILKYKELYA